MQACILLIAWQRQKSTSTASTKKLEHLLERTPGTKGEGPTKVGLCGEETEEEEEEEQKVAGSKSTFGYAGGGRDFDFGWPGCLVALCHTQLKPCACMDGSSYPDLARLRCVLAKAGKWC